MPIWHQSPKLTPRYFLETPRLFGYPMLFEQFKFIVFECLNQGFYLLHHSVY